MLGIFAFVMAYVFPLLFIWVAGALLILASMAMASFGQREGPEAPGGPEPQTAQEEDAPQRALREEASAPGA